MKKKLYIIVIVLLLLNIFLLRNLFSNNELIRKVDLVLDKKNEEILTFEESFIIEKRNNNLYLNTDVQFTDIYGNIFSAKEVFKNKVLVFRYSELNCKDCINAELEVLLKNKLKNDIFLITHCQNKRDLFVYYEEFRKKGLKNIKMFQVNDGGLGIAVDQINMPYYFCIDNNLEMTNLFIPQKDKPQLSESYLINTSKNFIGNNAVR